MFGVIETKSLPKLSSQDEAEAVGGLVAALDIQIKEATAAMNRAEFAAQDKKKVIQELQRKRSSQAKRLEDWCLSKDPGMRERLGQVELRQAILRFKITNPCIVLLNDWTEEKVIAGMKRAKKLFRFIRFNPEINKQAILVDSKLDDPTLTAKDLKNVGLEIGRRLYFSCESKLEKSA